MLHTLIRLRTLKLSHIFVEGRIIRFVPATDGTNNNRLVVTHIRNPFHNTASDSVVHTCTISNIFVGGSVRGVKDAKTNSKLLIQDDSSTKLYFPYR